MRVDQRWECRVLQQRKHPVWAADGRITSPWPPWGLSRGARGGEPFQTRAERRLCCRRTLSPLPVFRLPARCPVSGWRLVASVCASEALCLSLSLSTRLPARTEWS